MQFSSDLQHGGLGSSVFKVSVRINNLTRQGN
jgi:hypothetical protein